MRVHQILSATLDEDILYELAGDPNQVDQDEIDNPQMDADPKQNLPEPPQDMPPEQPEQYEPIDSDMMTSLQGQPYMRRYDFDDEQPTNPVNIMGMPVDQLSNLLNLVNHKMRLTQAKNQPGMYAGGSDWEFYQDLYNFVETVLSYKKKHSHGDIPDDIPQRAKELGGPHLGESVDWYRNMHMLRPGMVFKTQEGDLIRLDRGVPGDGTRWYADYWLRDHWSAEDFQVEPTDLVGEPLPDPAEQLKPRR